MPLKAFVVSDVHLNNHPYDHTTEKENPRRKNFRQFLSELNMERDADERVLLVLNGDILDITGSWFEAVMPWDSDPAKVEATLQGLILEILKNNAQTMDALRELMSHSLSEVHYVFGNHDGLLQRFPSCQQVIRDFLAAGDDTLNARLFFSENFASSELSLYAEHGHLLDPFNHPTDKPFSAELGTVPPVGDVVNILIVNKFVERAISRFRENGYPEKFITKIHSRLHDIEYLRPLYLLPVWIQTIANQYHSHPENLGKPQTIRYILIETVSEILRDPQMNALMKEQLHLPRRLMNFIVRLVLQIPAILPVVSFITSKIARQGHSNKYQYQAAQRIYQSKGYRLIVFGHTHIPGVLPLSESAYYFNTGSWKPVINLFKHSQDPVELEYLNPDVQFNKVERSGILRIEKPGGLTHKPAEFALQTIQSGLG